MDVLLARGDGRLEIVCGAGRFTAGGAAWLVADRSDPFTTVGASWLVGGGDTVDIDGPWTAIVRRDATVETRAITDVAIEQRGEGPTARTVRTYVAEGPLICGETISPPGGWSSWPPHRHEHEEVYLYHFDHPDGFGVQMTYDRDPGAPSIVRDGHVERIRGTYHPVVASPRSAMLYLWALAGASMTLTPEPDPRYT